MLWTAKVVVVLSGTKTDGILYVFGGGLLYLIEVLANLSPIPKPAHLDPLVLGKSYPTLGHDGSLTWGRRFSVPKVYYSFDGEVEYLSYVVKVVSQPSFL